MSQQRNQLISSRNTDDQRILESDWTRGTPGHTQPRVEVLCTTFPWWLSLSKKSKMSISPFQWHCWLKNCIFWLVERHNWPQPTKSGSLRSYLSLMTNSMQKTKILIDSFQRNWWSKNPVIQMGRRLNWLHPTKSGGPRCYLSLMYNLMYKKLLWPKNPAIWLDKRLYLATLWCKLIPSRDIDG